MGLAVAVRLLLERVPMKLTQRRVGNGTFAVAHAVTPPRFCGVGKIATDAGAGISAMTGDFAHPTSGFRL